MLSVGKMTHATSIPAEKPKALQESQITKGLTKAKSKGIILKEKDVVSTSNLSEFDDN